MTHLLTAQRLHFCVLTNLHIKPVGHGEEHGGSRPNGHTRHGSGTFVGPDPTKVALAVAVTVTVELAVGPLTHFASGQRLHFCVLVILHTNPKGHACLQTAGGHTRQDGSVGAGVGPEPVAEVVGLLDLIHFETAQRLHF